MLDSSDLAAFLDQRQIEAEVVILPEHTPTVEDAARAVKTVPDRIVKSLLFLVDGEPVVAIACGLSHVDRRTISLHYGVGRKRVKLADAETVLNVTGYPVGAMPPFGHRQALPTLMDKRVLLQPEVYAGGGQIDALLRISPGAILRVTSAIELDLIEPPKELP
ncbi:MAG: YbaK/EbsC family protein [Anaerolineales bacterium]|jgi:prolyl-tRNA editing enzyme YbaK/EbsC (Cys-tRNA(Pro) deacylase)